MLKMGQFPALIRRPWHYDGPGGFIVSVVVVGGCVSVEMLPWWLYRVRCFRVGLVVPFHTTYMDDSGKNTRHHGTVAVCKNLELLLLDVVGCFYHWLCHNVRKMLKMGR